MIKNYYRLAKPGIVYGNVLTTIAGFLFASRWQVDPEVFLATVFGIALVIGSAAVCNNYTDRHMDSKMSRTKTRVLVSGAISSANALVYAAVLGVVGFGLLFLFVQVLTALMALVGFVFYTVFYGWSKRASHWGAVVGSVAGAMPILVGYTAGVHKLDLPALILFLILVTWQMPHFYAIAMYRLDEYVAAGVPVLPAQKGLKATKIHIVLYIAAYLVAVSLLFFIGAAGYGYLVSVLLFGGVWLWLSMGGFNTPDDDKWARRLFRFSLVVILAFSVTLAVAPFLP